MRKRQKRDGKDRSAEDEQKRQTVFFEAACLAIQRDHLERVKELVAEGMDLSAIDNSTGAPLRFKEALFEYGMSRRSFKVLIWLREEGGLELRANNDRIYGVFLYESDGGDSHAPLLKMLTQWMLECLRDEARRTESREAALAIAESESKRLKGILVQAGVPMWDVSAAEAANRLGSEFKVVDDVAAEMGKIFEFEWESAQREKGGVR